MTRLIRSPRPVSIEQSLTTAASYVAVVFDVKLSKYVRVKPSVYVDGTGSWPDAAPQMDCVGAAVSRFSELPRHRPGFNKNLLTKLLAQGMDPVQAEAYAFVLDIEDDVNTTSLIGDALSDQDLSQIVDEPQPGDWLAYPTVKLKNAPGKSWEGHIAKVVGTKRARDWDPTAPNYSLLDTIQCTGPNGRTPGIVAMDGRYFDEWLATWPLPQHRPRILRPFP